MNARGSVENTLTIERLITTFNPSSLPVVDAVMYADRPSASPMAGFTPTTAVHVAEALVQRAVGIIGGGEPFLDQDYLLGIGLEDRLKNWEKEVEQVVEETFRDEEREGNVSEPVLQETATE